MQLKTLGLITAAACLLAGCADTSTKRIFGRDNKREPSATYQVKRIHTGVPESKLKAGMAPLKNVPSTKPDTSLVPPGSHLEQYKKEAKPALQTPKKKVKKQTPPPKPS
jgi:hypothetical protein